MPMRVVNAVRTANSPAIPLLRIFFSFFCPPFGHEKAPYFYDAHFGILNCDLCVSHIDEITVRPDTFIPDPDIGYILVFISAHAELMSLSR